MPSRAKSPCPAPGCHALTDGGRCELHRKESRQQTDERRESSHKRGYGPTWQKARAGWLRAHPLCGDRHAGPCDEHSICLQSGLISAATDVDHIVAVDGPADPLFWKPGNWQSLCHACHSHKTATEDGGFGRGDR